MDKYFGILLFACLCFTEVKANHLVGGEMSYECLGGNQFEITLTIYRDCYADQIYQNTADFDDPAYVFLYNGFTYLDRFELNHLSFQDTTIPPQSYLCQAEEIDVCVEYFEYSIVINIPNGEIGYYLVYQRCCRNNSIVNIPFPGDVGSTYEVYIPPYSGSCDNSSPSFIEKPPIVICRGFELQFDFSALDLDEDSLVYSLCDPFNGALDICPQPGDPNCPEPYDYFPINWNPGYTAETALGSNSSLSIDSETGLLTCTPMSLGQFVIGVCVAEYRNGDVLTTTIRDFQFNVAPCDVVDAEFGADALEISPGNYQIVHCTSFLVNYENNSPAADDYYWDFGDLSTTDDFSFEENPNYLYPDTGTYVVMLIANPTAECNDTAIASVFLYPEFHSDFTADGTYCSDRDVQFTDLTAGTLGVLESWYWDFGGAGNSEEQNPVFSFENPGIYDITLISGNDLGCVDEITYPIEIVPTPSIILDFNPLCLNELATFEIYTSSLGTLEFLDFELLQNNIVLYNSTDEVNNEYLFTSPGNYSVNVNAVNQYDCSNSETFNFEIYPEIVVTVPAELHLCVGEEFEIFGSAIGGSSTNNDFFWKDEFSDVIGEGVSFSSIVLDTMLLQFLGIDPNNCRDIDTIMIYPHPFPEIILPENEIVCLGDTYKIMPAFVSDNVVSIQWFDENNNDLYEGISLSITPMDSMLIIAEAANDYCSVFDSIELYVQGPIIAPQIVENQIICEGDSIALWAEGGLYYEWSPLNSLITNDSSTVIAFPSETTEYSVNISNDCYDVNSNVIVEVLTNPVVEAGPDFNVNIGTVVTLEGSGEGNPIWWTNQDGNYEFINSNYVIQVQPIVPTMYYISTETAEGCLSIDSAFVDLTYDFEIIIPNAFSPNSDDLNEVFRIFETKGIQELQHFIIFNRWGEIVYKNDSNVVAEIFWDGTYKNQDQEIGVYAYSVVALKYGGGIYENFGNVTLLR